MHVHQPAWRVTMRESMGSITGLLCKKAIEAVARADPTIEDSLRAELARKAAETFALNQEQEEVLGGIIGRNGGISAEHRSAERGQGVLVLYYWCRLTAHQIGGIPGIRTDDSTGLAHAISSWFNRPENYPRYEVGLLLSFAVDLDEEPLPQNPNPRETAMTLEEGLELLHELNAQQRRLRRRAARLERQIVRSIRRSQTARTEGATMTAEFCGCIQTMVPEGASVELGCVDSQHEAPYVVFKRDGHEVGGIPQNNCRGNSAFVALANCSCQPIVRKQIEDQGP